MYFQDGVRLDRLRAPTVAIIGILVMSIGCVSGVVRAPFRAIDVDGTKALVGDDLGAVAIVPPVREQLAAESDRIDEVSEKNVPPSLGLRIVNDHQQFYSSESLALLGGGLAIGGVVANTSIDGAIHRHFQTSVRSASSDDWFHSLHSSKELGNGAYILPLFASAWAVGHTFPNTSYADTSATWGQRSMRGFLVGAPPLIGLQHLTGGSRPDDPRQTSHWRAFADNNGISGHSFMGALPFITAAKMTDSRVLKTGLYAASTIAPLSRVNDNAHYPSQVALGWWMAFLAASAVEHTDSDAETSWRLSPYTDGDTAGLVGELKF